MRPSARAVSVDDRDAAPGRRATGRLVVDGAQLHYEVCGRGPAIVFAHGLGGSHLSWWQQVGRFGETHTCVTFAHRGFAPSSVDGDQPDPRRYADDLAALIDHLELDRVCLVGQSMGGWTVVEYGLRHPDRVSGLVLSATVGSVDPRRIAGLDALELEAWQRAAEASVARCRALRIHPAAGPRMAREQPALHLLYQQIDEQTRHLDKERLRGRLREMRTRSPSDLAATRAPLLLLAPSEDIVIPPIALRALAGEVPGARCIELGQVGHSPYFEAAARFNEILDGFLRDIDRDPPRGAHAVRAGAPVAPTAEDTP